jgi:hypothetical protein
MVLLLTASTHGAAYLTCKGEEFSVPLDPYRQGAPATISVNIEGTNVKVEDLAPVQISLNDQGVLWFGDIGKSVSWGYINRITGQAEIMITTVLGKRWFNGECHKSEKLF